MMVRSGRLGVMAAGMLMLGGAEAAYAVTYYPVYWNGNSSTDWFDGGNWVGGVAPTANNLRAYFNTTNNYWPVFNGSTEVYTIELGAPSGATLDILGGSTLKVYSSVIGAMASGNSSHMGTLRIANPGAVFDTGFLYVGDGGTGTVTVENGGLLKVGPLVSSTTFGGAAGSSGTLTVKGSGSKWLSTAGAIIGNSGTGRVEITDGAYASLNSATVGNAVGGVGTLLIDGKDTKVDFTTSFFVIGGAGLGEVKISGGANVSTYERFWLGYYTTGSGKLTVTGEGSLLKGTGPTASFTIGYVGPGDVLIDNGGTISAYTTQIGWMPTASGTLTISGAGSRLLGTNFLMIGYDGKGEVTLRDGGTASLPGRTTYIGNRAGSTGILNIGAAAGGAAANPGYLDVAKVQLGPNGNGKLVFNHLSDSYTFAPAISGNGAIEQYSGVTTLSGDNSSFTGNTKILGGTLVANGPFGGALSITNGSTTLIGGTGGSTLKVSGSGASFNTSFLDVGYGGGIGNIVVENGGLLNVGNPSLSSLLGNTAGSSGTVTVKGAGSKWLSTAAVTVGNSGAGKVEIIDGAYASLNSATVGRLAGSTGAFLADGTGTKVDLTTASFTVGGAGQGEVKVTGGAVVSTYERLVLGGDVGGLGKLAVSGQGSLLQGTGPAASFTIGYAGSGDGLIDNGGTISAYTTQLGWMPSSSGKLTISGAGSRLVGTDSLMIGYDGSGEVTLKDGGTASLPSRTAYIGNRAGSSGILNIGAAAGSGPASPGSLDAAKVQFGAGSGKLVFNHLSDSYTFSPSISGNGAIEQYAGVTILTGDNSAFTGMTTVRGGKLVANGPFGGTLSIESGSRLGGTGTLGSTTIKAGAVHAPGNSIGTQTINGNYVNNGVLEIEATPTANDKLIVNGTVNITGATLRLLLSPADSASWPVVGPSFTIIENDGADPIIGTFGSITSNLFFLDNIVNYAGGDGNDLAFSFNRNNVTFASLAATPNQAAVAVALEKLALGNPVWNAMAFSTDLSAMRAGLDMLSGEMHATALGSLLEDSHFVRDAIGERFDHAVPGEPAFWFRGYGSWRDNNGNGNASSYSSATGGFLTGVDGDLEDWRLGLLAGYGHTDLDVGQRRSSAHIESYHLGAYAGHAWGPLNLRSGLAYSWHGLDTRRSVALGAFTDSLSANYDASTFQAFGEIGYAIPAGPAAQFEPFAGLAYVHVRGDGFSERGGAAALSAGKQSQDATFTTIGVRAKADFDLDGTRLNLSGSLAWRHAFGDVDPSRTVSMAGAGSFGVDGTPIARDVAIVGASIEASLSATTTLGVGYQGQFSGRSNDHNVKARLQVSF